MNKKIAVMFSGGCDSTLAAAMAAEKYDKVQLLTYYRSGLFKAVENPKIGFERLRDKFGADKFDIEIMNVDKYFKRAQYDNYPYYVKKYGSICMSICGLCKLAMDWQTILYCIEHSITGVWDGAVKEMKAFPTQNMKIALEDIGKLYLDFNIDYRNPVYEIGKDVERMLYGMKLIPSPKHKGTGADKQVVCSQQILFSQFVEYYLSIHSWEDYVKNMREFYSEKIDDIRRDIMKDVRAKEVFRL
jgi:hypothetical protein